MILRLFPDTTTQTDCPVETLPVLHVINGEHYSGAERVQDLLACRLPEFGYRVDFASLKQGLFAENRRCQDSSIHPISMRGKWDVVCYRELVRLIRQHDYRLIHAHTPRSLMIASFAAAAAKIPLVYHVHSPVGRDSNRGWGNRINSWIERRCLKNVSQMICVSNSLQGYMREQGHSSQRLTVIHNGVPINELTSTRPPQTGPWTLGTIALFRPRKGTEVLLQAVGLLKRQGTIVNLKCIGPFETATYGEELKSLVSELGIVEQVEWTGFERDIKSRLAQLHALILPSLYGEGLPMVVLEAMAAGVPVVASRVEGVPEALRDGIDGYICQPNDPQDLAAKLARLLNHPEKWPDLSRSAWHQHRQNFSDEAMAKKLADVYDRLLDPSQPLNILA